jgi:ribosomal protein S18 acetylase RimI-like enzyme
MSDISVREATPEDLSILLQFEEGVIEAERSMDSGLKEGPINYYDIDRLIASPDLRLAVAEKEGELVGCGYARLEAAKPYLKYVRQAYLGFMYVRPDHRGRGINQLILDDLYRWSLSRGVTEVRLEVYPTNSAAIRAYEKAGFTPYILQMHATIGIRRPERYELDHLAKLWYDSWQDAHAEILPDELKQDRTPESFRKRLPELLDDTMVIGPLGRPFGLCTLRGDELYQLYVAREARGSGAARCLIEDAEQRMRDQGTKTAWLACAIGNDRAARFYEKSGWRNAGTVRHTVELETGQFTFDIWRYEKEF